MTLRFIDSFDHYATADIIKKWSAYTTGTQDTVSISPGNGRSSTQCARILGGNSTGSSYFVKSLDAQASWVIGFGLNISAIGGYALEILRAYDGATQHVGLVLNSTGTISITRAGTVLGTSVLTLSGAAWHFIELKFTVSDTAGIGTVVLKVDGVVWVTNGVAWDTRNAGNATVDTFWLTKISASNLNGKTFDFDDIYIEDGVDATATQGAPFNDFLGDCKVKAIYPTADGNYTGSWTRSAGGTDFGVVDEALQNSDTDYLSDNTVDHRSSYTFGTMGTVGTVKAVAINAIARKDDAGIKLLDVFARRTATDYDRDKDFNLFDSYMSFQDIWGVHPDTTPWTPAIVNALEAGIRMDT